jgi:hypothetical protein
VATKIDALDDPARRDALAGEARRRGVPFHAISAATGAGLAELVQAFARAVLDRDERPGERSRA